MDNLEAFQQDFLASLSQGRPMETGEQMTFCGELQSFDEALKIYQNNYYESLKKSLADTYEACFKMLTSKLFDPLAWGFIQNHPLEGHDLANYGEEFPRFLGKAQASKSFPFIEELACLERAIGKLFRKEIRTSRMEVSHPVHQIWHCVLYEEGEIEDFEEKKNLTVTYKEKNIFFQLEAFNEY